MGRSPRVTSVAQILSYGRESVRLSLAFPVSELEYLREISRGSGQSLATVIVALLHRQILEARRRGAGTLAKQGMP